MVTSNGQRSNDNQEHLSQHHSITDQIQIRSFPLITKVSRLVAEHLLGHDGIYDSYYYANFVEGPAVGSAGVISESIMFDLKPKTIVDVGCGTGALLQALRNRGCDVFGLDYSEVALEYCRARGLDVLKFDLERDVLNSARSFDVVISMEVGEHLPEKVADRYVDCLRDSQAELYSPLRRPARGVITT